MSAIRVTEEPEELGPEEIAARIRTFEKIVDEANEIVSDEPPLQFSYEDKQLIAHSRTLWIAAKVAEDETDDVCKEILFVVMLMMIEALIPPGGDGTDIPEGVLTDLRKKFQTGVVISVKHAPNDEGGTFTDVTIGFGEDAVARLDPIVNFGADQEDDTPEG